MPPLSLCKCLYVCLHATFVFFCATVVVKMYFSYSICLLYILEKLIHIYFWIWHNDMLFIKFGKHALTKNNAPVNHFKESNITFNIMEGKFLLLIRMCSWIFDSALKYFRWGGGGGLCTSNVVTLGDCTVLIRACSQPKALRLCIQKINNLASVSFFNHRY